MREPADVIPYLGRSSHWKHGRSAKSLADLWFRSGDIPASVRQLLVQNDVLARAELLEAWLERETDLDDGRGSPSQTDLLAILGLDEELAILGIEAKVDESFGPTVSGWLENGGLGRERRLQQLCSLFSLDSGVVGDLRYQLLHRTAAVIYEARRFRSQTAILILQSFCSRATGLNDCVAFFDAIGLAGFGKDVLAGPQKIGGVLFWAGWASDEPLADPFWDDFFAQPGIDIERGPQCSH